MEKLQYVVPDRRDGGGDRRASLFDHVHQRGGLQEAVWQQQVGACHDGRVRLTPGVGVEHRDNRQDTVAVDEADSVGRTDRHRMQVARAVAVHHTLWVSRRAAGVTHCGGTSFVQFGPVELHRLSVEQVVVADHGLARGGMSTSTTRSSAWLAMNAICSPASRMFSVCSTAPMHGAAK